MDSVTLDECSTVDLNNSFYIHRDLETDLQHQQPPDLPEIKPITPPKSTYSQLEYCIFSVTFIWFRLPTSYTQHT